MGYTHYWYQMRDATPDQWVAICEAAQKIVAKSAVPVSREYDEKNEQPFFGIDKIRLNGVGDDGHETFLFTRKKGRPLVTVDDGSTFAFCKTAHKPYDIVVCAILVVAHHYAPDVWRIESDGDPDAWMPGLRLACFATGIDMAMALAETE